MQDIHPRTREQGIVKFERGVFRGGADKDQRAVFHVRQEGILLRLVETVYFIDKQNGPPAILRRLLLGNFHRLTDLLDPREHRRKGFEVGLGDFRQQPCQGGFAHPRRAPEDHRMQRALLQRLTQWLARRQQVLLTDILLQVGGP